MFLDYNHTPTVQVVINMSTMAAGSRLNSVCRLCYVIAGHDKFMHIFLESNIKSSHQSHKLQYLCNFILFGGLCTVLQDGWLLGGVLVFVELFI